MDKNISSNKDDTIKQECMETPFSCYSFSDEIENDKVLFNVIKMKDSIYVWIGNSNNPIFNSLAMSIPTSQCNDFIDASILETPMFDYSKPMALRLSKKLKKQVYFSFNVPDNKLVVPSIEKRLYKEIEDFPNKF